MWEYYKRKQSILSINPTAHNS